MMHISLKNHCNYYLQHLNLLKIISLANISIISKKLLIEKTCKFSLAVCNRFRVKNQYTLKVGDIMDISLIKILSQNIP